MTLILGRVKKLGNATWNQTHMLRVFNGLEKSGSRSKNITAASRKCNSRTALGKKQANSDLNSSYLSLIYFTANYCWHHIFYNIKRLFCRIQNDQYCMESYAISVTWTDKATRISPSSETVGRLEKVKLGTVWKNHQAKSYAKKTNSDAAGSWLSTG